jgi:hypothetical protein
VVIFEIASLPLVARNDKYEGVARNDKYEGVARNDKYEGVARDDRNELIPFTKQ